jgi:uncharacterized damage-inducible protein DinB
MTTNLQQLFRHDLWANRLIVDACAALTPDQLEATAVGTYGSIGRTLWHLIAAEDSYASRLVVRDRTLRYHEDAPVPPIDALRATLEAVGPELIELAGSTSETRTVEVSGDDGVVTLPAWILLVQTIDHGREHRTHIATILTQLGIEPPGMDGWDFFDSGRATDG